ncbi:MAG: WG repeat-containing protein, partial [Bacteroidales bacterium]|nr:WG repeat-containing protein [Bacteroidales bacterium]
EGFAIKRELVNIFPLEEGSIFINKDLEPQTEEHFEKAIAFSEGYAAIKYNGKWGFINSEFNHFLDIKYDNAQSFSDGLAPVKENKWGYINKEGEYVISCKYDSCTTFKNRLAYVWINDNNFLIEGYINKAGTFIWYNEKH